MTDDPYVAPAGASIQQMLDGGRPGFNFLTEMVSNYQLAIRELHLPGKEMERNDKLDILYNAESGMDLDPLKWMAAAFGSVAQTARHELDDEKRLRDLLPSVWKGEAGDGAHAKLSAQINRADTDLPEAEKVVQKIKDAESGIREAVKHKVDSLGKYRTDFPPRPQPDPNSLTIDVIYRAKPYADWLRDHGGSEDGFSSPYNEKEAYEWAKKDFMPHVETFVADFLTINSDTKSQITGLYEALATELEQLDTSEYPMPDDVPPVGKSTGQPKENTGTPGPSQPEKQTQPAGTPQSPTATTPANTTTTPSATTPSTTTSNPLDGLASLSQVASSLTSQAGTLAQTIGQQVSALSGAITEGVDGAIEKIQGLLAPKEVTDADGDGKPDQKTKPLAEFDVAGKHLKLEMGSDGELKLETTGADGKPQEFKVTLDQNGVPHIETGSGDEEGPAGDQPTGEEPEDSPSEKEPEDTAGDPGETEEGTGAPVNTPPVPPAGKPGEDGEHQPQFVPEPTDGEQDSGQPPDSGAELAEAGPL